MAYINHFPSQSFTLTLCSTVELVIDLWMIDRSWSKFRSHRRSGFVFAFSQSWLFFLLVRPYRISRPDTNWMSVNSEGRITTTAAISRRGISLGRLAQRQDKRLLPWISIVPPPLSASLFFGWLGCSATAEPRGLSGFQFGPSSSRKKKIT